MSERMRADAPRVSRLAPPLLRMRRAADAAQAPTPSALNRNTMSAFLLCFAAWSAIALGMERHHEDARGREGSAPRLRHMRFAGGALLLFSLWLAARPPGGGAASLHVTQWAVALSAAAVAVVPVVTWCPRRAPAVAAAALATGLATSAGGW